MNANRVGRWSVAVAVVVAMAAGCSSSAKKTTGTTTAGGGGATTTTSSSGGSGSSGQLGSLAQEIQGGQHSVFKAVYTYSGAGQSGTTVTVEQDPPKSVFITDGGEVLATGTATYYCSTGAAAQCVNAGSGSANPLAGLSDVFSANNVLSAIRQAEADAAAHAQGYNASFSTQSFGGVSADCVTLTASNQTGKYCVTHNGILAYSGTSTASFQLTSYSGNPSPSDFSLPAGATITSVP